jgi:hypothetical protein
MAILNNSNAISSGGYDINNSLRFRSSATAYLNRTPASAGNRKTWTWSGWVKRGAIGFNQRIFRASASGSEGGIQFYSGTNNDGIELYDYTTSYQWVLDTTQLFRDPSAWYHIVLAFDTTQATSANRVKFYVNGNQVTAFSTSTYPSLNYEGAINNNIAHTLGGSDSIFDGYMADINFIDGSAKTPSDFGETDTTTGSWKPKAYTGTYGTNGFYLKFSDIATTSGSNAGLGKDFSGNTNYWTTNNISVTAGSTYDAMIDSPTLTSATTANYCVWNPLNSGATLSEANLTATTSAWNDASGSMAMSSGKWYAEFTYNSSTSTNALVGITLASFNGTGQSDTFRVAYQTIGTISRDGVASPADLTGYPTYTLGDIIGIALDVSAGTITFYKNNSSVYTLTTSVISSNEWRFFVRMNTRSFIANFGQRPFSYTPPTGFVRLNAYNLPDSTIKKGNSYMNAVTYTGSASNVTVTSGFYPDLTWAKSRNNTYNHSLVDSNRGGNVVLFSNLTNAESTVSGLATFSSTGVTYLAGASGVNADASTNYILWAWNAGSGSTSSNTSGSITSTVSVNATAGFSVVTYAGVDSPSTNTIGHGLGVAPKFWIIKNRSGGTGAYNWVFNYVLNGTVYYMFMNNTQAANAQGSPWSTLPTSSVITLGANDTNTCNAGDNYVCYAWAEIAGFSKFTSYTGNGSTSGPFVYLGFRPKFVMIKRTDSTNDWNMYDSSIGAYNVITDLLKANTSAAQTNYYTYGIDFLSNGFKLRETDTGQNASGGTYIVAAFAENPFKNSNAR